MPVVLTSKLEHISSLNMEQSTLEAEQVYVPFPVLEQSVNQKIDIQITNEIVLTSHLVSFLTWLVSRS